MRTIKFLSCASMLIFFSCPNDDVMEDTLDEAVVEVNVVDFVYSPQTETVPERLVYNIELTNTSDVDAQGGLKLTTDADGLITTTIPTSNSQCYQIMANSTCLYSFDETGILEILAPDSISLVSAEYVFF